MYQTVRLNEYQRVVKRRDMAIEALKHYNNQDEYRGIMNGRASKLLEELTNIKGTENDHIRVAIYKAFCKAISAPLFAVRWNEKDDQHH